MSQWQEIRALYAEAYRGRAFWVDCLVALAIVVAGILGWLWK